MSNRSPLVIPSEAEGYEVGFARTQESQESNWCSYTLFSPAACQGRERLRGVP
jgi:hypothetical protein